MCFLRKQGSSSSSFTRFVRLGRVPSFELQATIFVHQNVSEVHYTTITVPQDISEIAEAISRSCLRKWASIALHGVKKEVKH